MHFALIASLAAGYATLCTEVEVSQECQEV